MNYKAINKESQEIGEGRDCVIKAISLVTGKPYKDVHQLAEHCGRRPGRGVPEAVGITMLRILGFEVRRLDFSAKTAITIERELRAKHSGRRFIVSMTRHWAAFDGKQIDDWSKGSRKQVNAVYFLIPKTVKILADD